MEPDRTTPYYQSLSPLEQDYFQRFFDVFQLVQPKKPEVGIRVLIQRARDEALIQNISLEEALNRMLVGATERTLRRVALLNQCSLPEEPERS